MRGCTLRTEPINQPNHHRTPKSGRFNQGGEKLTQNVSHFCINFSTILKEIFSLTIQEMMGFSGDEFC